MPRPKKIKQLVNEVVNNEDITELVNEIVNNEDNAELVTKSEKIVKPKKKIIPKPLSNMYKCPKCGYCISKLVNQQKNFEIRKCDNGYCQWRFFIYYDNDESDDTI